MGFLGAAQMLKAHGNYHRTGLLVTAHISDSFVCLPHAHMSFSHIIAQNRGHHFEMSKPQNHKLNGAPLFILYQAVVFKYTPQETD